LKSAEQEDIRVGLFKTKRIHLRTRGIEQDEGYCQRKLSLSVFISCKPIGGEMLRLDNNIVCVTVGGWLIHCKKRLAIFPSPAGMSITKLSPGGE
jgi:hypothetical protein